MLRVSTSLPSIDVILTQYKPVMLSFVLSTVRTSSFPPPLPPAGLFSPAQSIRAVLMLL